ncbi:MAG: hypothetical protein AAF532_03555 [Planctomycetota bacterium]
MSTPRTAAKKKAATTAAPKKRATKKAAPKTPAKKKAAPKKRPTKKPAAKKRGRPKGAKTNPPDEMLVMPPACPECGSTEHNGYFNVRTHDLGGERGGRKYARVRWRDTHCAECGTLRREKVLLSSARDA